MGVKAEIQKLSAEIRHKRELLTKAVQLSGDFQSEAVLRLSREIDTLIVRYIRQQSPDKFPQALGAILLLPLFLFNPGAAGHYVSSQKSLDLGYQVHQSAHRGRRARNWGWNPMVPSPSR